jgi:pilus assembly protein CpaE
MNIGIIVFDKNKEISNKIISLLKNISGLDVIGSENGLLDLETMLKQKEPAIVIIGPSYGLDEIEGLLKQYFSSLSAVKVIFLVNKCSENILKKAMRLNIYDVLEFPFAQSDIEEPIKKALDIFSEESIQKDKSKAQSEKKESKAKKILVFSAKGGSGKSFLSVNLGAELALAHEREVVLFDLNYQFGDVAMMLNLYPKHTSYDIISAMDQIDAEMLDSFLTVHKSGLKILPSPVNPSQGENISSDATLKIIDILSRSNQYLIMDTVSFFTDTVLSVLEDLDYLCVIASMDVPSIKNLKICLQILEQLKFDENKIIFVLNRANSKVGITLEEIEKTINKKVDIAIPSDRIVPMSINKGVPVISEFPRSAVTKSIKKLVKIISS